MQVALLTVGDEILTGDIENTNATWLARQLTERGASVVRILTVPDDEALIERTVREWSDAFDAVVVTGGLGGTHDDVTMDAVAAAFDRPLVLDEEAEAHVERRMATYRERHPEHAERYPEPQIDPADWASLPEGSRPLIIDDGLSPGCAIGNVYVFPGVPQEMKAMFDAVAGEFGGDAVSETLYTPAPEGALTGEIDAVRERFDVAVGSYPSRSTHNRIKVVGTDEGEVAAAIAWLRERVDVVEPK
ncbi:MAG: competence/damage-inducible protein A [Salinigranum sp.]